jgi:prevent-host-death family protein
MRTMSVSEFKAHALRVVGQVAETKQPVLVTKRGRPLVEIVPFRGPTERPVAGKPSATFVFEKDIVSPLGESTWGGRAPDQWAVVLRPA